MIFPAFPWCFHGVSMGFPRRQDSEALLLKAQHSVAALPGADLRLLNCVVDACAKDREMGGWDPRK